MTKREDRRQRMKEFMDERRRLQEEAYRPGRELSEQARDALRAGDLRRAERLLRKAVKADNDVPSELRFTRRDRRSAMYEAMESQSLEERNDDGC